MYDKAVRSDLAIVTFCLVSIHCLSCGRLVVKGVGDVDEVEEGERFTMAGWQSQVWEKMG